MLRKCRQFFLDELHGCEGEERRWLPEGYLALEGRGVCTCAVLKRKTGDDTPWNGSAQGSGQRYKRVRYRGEWDWELPRGEEPFCLPNGEFGKRKGGCGSINGGT